MRFFVLWLVVACASSAPRAATRDDAPVAGLDAYTETRRWFAGDVHMHVSPPDHPRDVMLSVAELAVAATRAGMDFVILTPHLWSWRWPHGGEIRGSVVTLEWDGSARVFVDNVDHGEPAGRFTHATGGELHTYRIELGASRSGFIYANL